MRRDAQRYPQWNDRFQAVLDERHGGPWVSEERRRWLFEKGHEPEEAAERAASWSAGEDDPEDES